MTTDKDQRLRESRKRSHLKRRADHIQARLPPELGRKFRQYLQTAGLNANQAIISILSNLLD
jgi:hypothetical protein